MRVCLAALATILLLAAAGAGGAEENREQACLGCHPTPGLVQRMGTRVPLAAPAEAARYRGSAHWGLSCFSCHPGTTPGPHASKPVALKCLDCHGARGTSRAGAPATPIVGQLHPAAGKYAPNCETCHGHHEVGARNDPASPIFRRNAPALCEGCHADSSRQPQVRQVDYSAGVHGRALRLGRPGQRPAVCSDCHTMHATPENRAHSITPAPAALSATCGRCHPREYEGYARSSHGLAAAAGKQGAPACVTCHGAHRILGRNDEGTPMSPHGSVQICGSCHANQELIRLYKLPPGALSSYEESYHGVANRYGSVRAAHCVSCHGAHDVLPSSDPRSAISQARLPATCGRCHPGAGALYPIGRVHVFPSLHQDQFLFLVRSIYQFMVVMTLLGFLSYMGLDLVTHLRLKRAGIIEDFEHHMESLPPPPPQALERMTRAERIQHIGLLTSFTVLALTGVVLLIPDTMFARVVIFLCGGMTGRAILHRIAAVTLLGLAFSHLMWVVTTRRGWETFKEILPRPSDLGDAVQTAFLLVGRRQSPPCFRRFNFLEKFEYWALVWGTFIMTLTGLIMWLDNMSLAYLPKWAMDLGGIIHTWEAVLAVATIAIWHLYHTLWKPDVFPGNRAWIDGRIRFEEYVRDHPLQYAEAMGWLPEDDHWLDDARERVRGWLRQEFPDAYRALPWVGDGEQGKPTPHDEEDES